MKDEEIIKNVLEEIETRREIESYGTHDPEVHEYWIKEAIKDTIKICNQAWQKEKKELEKTLNTSQKHIEALELEYDFNKDREMEAYKKDLIKKIKEERKGKFDTNRDWYYALKWCENLIENKEREIG